MACRRLVIRPTTAPAAGEQVQLTLQADAVRDLFLNPMSAVFQTTVTWPASGEVVASDSADPEVEELRLRDGHLEIIFSEPPDLASASSAVQVDGASLSWNLEPDGYTLRSVDPLAVGAHTVTIAAGAPLDRAGQGVVTEFSESITVTASVDNEQYFSKADPREVGVEALVNRFAFHGRPVDLETGLVYFRNRYYDPEMGRFVTADPLGFVDGPSMYGFGLNNPINNQDPLGLATYFFDGTWNCRDKSGNVPTNVQKLHSALDVAGERVEYVEGIGCQGGIRSRLDGVFAYSEHAKLREMYKKFLKNWSLGDREVNIVGFSRGAALARKFAAYLNFFGVREYEKVGGKVYSFWGAADRVMVKNSSVEVNFLGLFDTVASGMEGKATVSTSVGMITYNPLAVYSNVKQASHAISEGELRATFPLESIHGSWKEKYGSNDFRRERRFRGVHSDIGGGYINLLGWVFSLVGGNLAEIRTGQVTIPAANLCSTKINCRQTRSHQEALPTQRRIVASLVACFSSPHPRLGQA